MLKRLFTAFLTAVMTLSLCTAVIATDETSTETPEKVNIYEKWGDFEDEQYWEGVKFKFFSEGSIESRAAEGGANGTNYSFYFDQHTGTWKDLRVASNLVAGETYDISLYLKSDSPDVTSVSFIIAYVEGEYVQSGSMPISEEWTKISYSIKMPSGKSANRITLRFNNGQTDYKIYFDELCVIPKGDVPEADYSKIDVGLFGVETDDGIEVTQPAEYYDVAFSDIDSHWAESTITSLAKYGYVNGISPFEFAPESNVTRAQFIKMMTELYDDENESYDGRFADVTADQWFADVLTVADEKGLIPEEMKADGKINPDVAITREEAAVIAAMAAVERGAKENASVSFSDINDAADWAKAGIKQAAALGMINGYDDGKFLPKANITRAEASQILMRVIEVSTRFNIYVDAKRGNDANDGTENAPLATIYAARDMAKKFAPAMKNDITIRIRGEQYLEKTFKLDETNSGQNGYKIVYTSWDDEKATLTMAKKFSGFKLHDVDKNIWKLYVGKGTFARQVYFNDVRGVRSRTVGYLENPDYIYDSHFLCDNNELLYLKYPSEVEGVFNNRWMQFQYKVSKISKENDRVRLDFNDYFLKYHNYLKVYDGDKNLIRQTPSFLENAYEFLDCGGEWYLNKHDGYLYYIPRDGEDMKTMECKVPIGEQLVEVAGSSYFTPVTYIAFDNLVMEGTDWKRIDEVGGYCPIQNNVYNDMSVGVQDKGAVHFDAARYIDFTNCDIRHTGQASAALMFWRGCKNVNVVGNEIYQTAGAGFMIDALSENVDRGGYSPQDRDPKEYTENFYIANNYIHSNAWVYHGGAQVGMGHPRHVVFTHNEVANAPYSGLHIGWGWGSLFDTGSVMYDVEISYNYIHDMMMGRVSDGAAIYTLGASSLECDKTNIEKNNVIKNNYLANGWKCDYIYPDMGSTSWYITKNVANRGYIEEHEYDYVEAPAARNLQFWAHMHSSTIHWITFDENYATDDFAWDRGLMNMRESVIDPVHITEDHNNMEAWPEAARQIMAEAGVEKAYRDNFKLDGPKIFNTNNRRQTIPLETPTDSGMMILGDNNTKYDLADFDIDWWCEDPEALTIDKNGMMTAHKKGTFEVEAMAFVDGMWQQTHFMIECGNEVESVTLSHEKLSLIKGFGVDVTALAKMTFGNGGDITAESKIEVKSNDTSIVTAEVANRGTTIRVDAVGEGETTISVSVTYRGKTFDLELPVKIISYNSDAGKDLPYSEIDMYKGWKVEGIKQPDGGILVYGSPNHYMIKRVDGLLAFDMSINPGSGWPSIAFADSDTMGNYATNDCYMIGFKPDHIEFQRWNKGERTMIFGNTQLPVSGPGIPNTGDNAIFGYNERVSVVAGAIKEEEGTRIILNINGENIIDYMDTGAKALPSSGYFVVYNPAPGGMTFYPYSGISK